MIILIMGPQGSGKGTQAKRLAQEFGLSYLDAGAILRKIAKQDPRIDEIVNKRGALLPDEEIFKIITNYLEEKRIFDDIILDGYPRSVSQYQLINDWFKNHGTQITRGLFLDVSEAVSIERLSSRRMDPTTGKIYNLVSKPAPEDIVGRLVQREDDKPEAIKERLLHYRETTEPLVNMLRQQGKLVEVNGERSIDEIHSEMKMDIETIRNS